MKCLQCGSAMKERREDFSYASCGLPVVLLNVVVRHCRKCDEHEAVIPAIEELHAALADALIQKRGRLVGAEIRFLRSWLGLAGQRFARWVGVQPETVSRWENDKAAIGETHERLLRIMAARRQFFADHDIASLLEAEFDRGRATATRMTASVTNRHWNVANAA